MAASDATSTLENLLLATLDAANGGSLDSDATSAFIATHGLSALTLGSILRSLEAHGLVTWQEHAHTAWGLTEEAEGYVAAGASPEAQVLLRVRAAGEAGLTMNQLKDQLGAAVSGVGFKQAMQHKWVALKKPQDLLGLSSKPFALSPEDQERVDALPPAEKKKEIKRLEKAAKPEPAVVAKVEEAADVTLGHLKAIREGAFDAQAEAKALALLKKRKLVQQRKWVTYSAGKGAKFALEKKKEATDLTHKMLANDEYASLSFKKYNFNAFGSDTLGGHLHPLLKVRTQFRKIFVRMGFEEMPTNRFVESSFWNFDALFQPQQHPARDAHDTFFLTRPDRTDSDRWVPQDYLERVREVHEVGGFGSIGYGYNWKLAEAEKNILRTHTTAVSSRMLYKLAKEYEQNGGGVFEPKRYFSIDRVFRNESVDKTHLAEFHQCEGLVAGRDLSLAHLLGTIHQFFRNIGMPDVKFKPAYNPYTEPSMEIFAYHPGLGKWVEIGNSGIFRPEMLRPMGLPEDVTVIAWGLSLERPTMILYGVDNIRDLFGHKVDLDMMKTNPICRIGLD